MIGNDVVDLEQAAKDSNWKRKGYLDKIYTHQEQQLFLNSPNASQIVWTLWTMKEAAYKIYSREKNIRIFAPTSLVCSELDFSKHTGVVKVDNKTYYTKSYLSKSYIHTLAAPSLIILSKIKEIVYLNPSSSFHYRDTNPKCVSHHGQYLALVY